jgi:hypothetical protein
MELKIDSEFRDLIPPLSADELLNLEQSILTEGCRDAIQTWNGFIVDGHNRYSICSRLNLPFKVEEKEFSSRNDVCIWMIQNQFARRNLSNYVRGGLGLRLEEFFRQKAEENKVIAGRYGAELTNSRNLEKQELPILAKPEINKVNTCEEIPRFANIGKP